MSIDIKPRQEGSVTLELSWEEAEVLTRAVGMVNFGDLSRLAPVLSNDMEALLQVFGRNTVSEANRFVARVVGGQVYVSDDAS